MSEQNGREIRIPGGTVRLTEEAWEEQAPTPALQERAQASLREADRRRRSVEEWKSYLSDQQRKALDEEGASGGFKSRLSLDAIKSFTPEEVDELMSAERAEYERIRPVTLAKSEQRRAFVSAGGDPESFEAMWEHGGRDLYIAQTADENLTRRVSSPY